MYTPSDMDDLLVATEFFGFTPEQLYHEVYAVGYNEFLSAVSSLRDTLLGEFPGEQGAVEECCSALLASYGRQFDEEWFTKFLQYCSKNVFTVPRHVPLYEEDLGREENHSAPQKIEELRHQIMATEYLNVRLQAQLRELDREIEKRRALLEQVKETEGKLVAVKRARELEGQLREVVGKLLSSEANGEQ